MNFGKCSDSTGAKGAAYPVCEVDVSEDSLAASSPDVLKLLLSDMTTGKNIIWATDNYVHLGPRYAPHREITIDAITGPSAGVIRPRVKKSKEQQLRRTKGKAEVFTPAWLCNEQNNRVDEAWFGRVSPFNWSAGRNWTTHPGPIFFDGNGKRTWKCYVDDRRLEMACGEAPYLVSRYDATTGIPIDLHRRIGLLDRKMRVVKENASTQGEWLQWSQRAFESVYAFEFQGDNLLLARENLLASYSDYMWDALRRGPTLGELENIARIVAWNTWQMDAFTNTAPFRFPSSEYQCLPNDFEKDEELRPCIIRDWRAERTKEYRSLMA